MQVKERDGTVSVASFTGKTLTKGLGRSEMRGFLRVHFLTGIILMLSAAFALWLNMSPVYTGKITYYRFFPENEKTHPTLVLLGRQATFGWPFQMKEADWGEYLVTMNAREETYKSGYIRAVVDQRGAETIYRSEKPALESGPLQKTEWLPDATLISMGIWTWPHAAWNGGIAIGFLIAVTLLTEFVLRRRERRAKEAIAVVLESR